MKYLKLLPKFGLMWAWVVAVVSTANGQIFNQDFNSSTTLADYLIGGSALGDKFDAFNQNSPNAIEISSSSLLFNRNASTNIISAVRSTNLTTTPSLIVVRFSISVSGNNAAQTSAARLQLGTGFSNSNSLEADASCYAQLGINFTATGGQFQLRHITTGTGGSNGGNVSGTQNVTWILNNTGSTVAYAGPDGNLYSLDNDKTDIWNGTTRTLSGQNVSTASQTVTDFKFIYDATTNNAADIRIDNLTISNLNINAVQQLGSALVGSTNRKVLLIPILTQSAETLTQLVLTTTGTTNTSDIQNARIWFTGTGDFATITQFGTTIASPSGTMTFTGSQALSAGVNNFWLSYDIAPGATVGNVVDATLTSATISSFTYTPVSGAPAGSITIGSGLPTNINVGTGETYTSLTNNGGLFQAINANGLSGNTTVTLTTDLTVETGTHSLYEWIGGYTLTIVPGAAGRLVSGSNATTLIDLNGADRVKIDGGNNGTYTGPNRMTIRQTVNGSTIRFINDATNIDIEDVIFQSNSTSSNGTLFFSTGLATGNDNISVKSCYLRNRSDATGNPRLAIFSNGTSSSISNNNLTFYDNDIVDYFHKVNGQPWIMNLSSNTDNVNFSNNHIYQTASYNFGNSSLYMSWIRIQGSNTDNILIKNNYFGGRAKNIGGGKYEMLGSDPSTRHGFDGIRVDLSDERLVTIEGNTIGNISTKFGESISTSSSRNYFIRCGSGKSIVKDNTFTDIDLNISGMASGPNPVFTPSILIFYEGSGSGKIINNIIQDIQMTYASDVTYGYSFEAIRVNPSTPGLLVSGNTVGSTTVSNSISIDDNYEGVNNYIYGISSAGSSGKKIINNTVSNLTLNGISNHVASTLAGIAVLSTATDTIKNNTIFNLTSSLQTSPTSNTAAVAGIYINSTSSNLQVSQNTIHSLLSNASSVTAGTTAAGILITGGASGRVEKSAIYNIRNTSGGTTPAAAGIVVREIGDKMFMTNNMISLGLTTSGGNNTEGAMYIGLWNNASDASSPIDTLFFVYNSVTIGGSTTSNYNTYGFLRGANDGSTQVTTPAFVVNNLFYNSRTGGTGGHYAIGNQLTCAGWGGNSCNGPLPPCTSSNTGLVLPNYNAFYASNANKLYHWLGTSYSLAGFLSLGNGADDESITVPNTMSFANRGIADLHVSNNDFQINAAALPLTNIALDDYDGEFRRGPDRGADEIINIVTFNNANTNGQGANQWNNPTNWTPPIVPTCSDKVKIPGGFNVIIDTNYPTGRSAAQCYRLEIENGATLTLQNNAVLEQCWFNGTTAAQTPYTISPFVTHEGLIDIKSGGSMNQNASTVKVAGRFDHSGTFNKGTSTVEMNFDTPSGNPCFSNFAAAYNSSIDISDIGGTAHTNFHNLSIINQGKTTILTNKDVTVGDATNDNGTLSISNNGWLNINGQTLRLEGYLAETNGTISGLGTNSTTTSKLIINGKGDLGGTVKFTAGDNDELRTLTINRATDGSTKGLATLANTIKVNNDLNLTQGRFKTGSASVPPYSKQIHVTNTALSAVTGGQPNGYVWGILRRNVTGTGNYTFPVGHGDRAEQMDVNLTANTNLTQLTAFFNPNDAGGSVATATEGVYTYGMPCEGGFWDLTPTPASPSVTYDLTLYPVGITCSLTTGQTIAKRASSANPFTFGGSTYSSVNTRTGFTNFSEFGYIYPNTVLPLTLLSFEAAVVEQGVSLNWATVSEYNFSHFVVERSTDGRLFIAIGVLQAKGGGSYQLIDPNPTNGVNYYRLRVVDNDGSSNLSKVVWVEFATTNQFSISLYPNPVSDGRIVLQCAGSDRFVARITDVLGAIVWQGETSCDRAPRIIQLPKDLSDGVYLLELQGESGHFLYRIQVVNH